MISKDIITELVISYETLMHTFLWALLRIILHVLVLLASLQVALNTGGRRRLAQPVTRTQAQNWGASFRSPIMRPGVEWSWKTL